MNRGILFVFHSYSHSHSIYSVEGWWKVIYIPEFFSPGQFHAQGWKLMWEVHSEFPVQMAPINAEFRYQGQRSLFPVRPLQELVVRPPSKRIQSLLVCHLSFIICCNPHGPSQSTTSFIHPFPLLIPESRFESATFYYFHQQHLSGGNVCPWVDRTGQ